MVKTFNPIESYFYCVTLGGGDVKNVTEPHKKMGEGMLSTPYTAY